jgi:hypothetical protein
MQVFASLPNILAPSPDAPLAAGTVSERRLETCMNIFGRDALLVEKPNGDSLVVLHPLNEKPQPDGPGNNHSKGTADVLPLSFSLSVCATETISLVRWEQLGHLELHRRVCGRDLLTALYVQVPGQTYIDHRLQYTRVVRG